MTGAALRSRSARSRSRSPDDGAASGLKAFVARLHFYVGLFVGPFILVAAVTGTLYALTPQIESWLYRDQLTTSATGPMQPLAAQAGAARGFAGEAPRLFAVRPAPAPGFTTRIMFTDPSLGPSESRAIFVDPVTLDIKGDLLAYGTSGVLPFRTTLDYLHRSLMLGDLGRAYSELAASWLWIAALGGVLLWAWRRTGRLARRNPGNTTLRVRRLHGLVGVTLSVGLLFLSVTGLTWSQWAGGRIDDLRKALGWITPSVSLALDGAAAPPTGEHAHHDHAGMTMSSSPSATDDPAARLDAVLAAARAGGIDSPMIEIRPPKAGQAWVVREHDRSWPTQVDTIAIDPASMAVTSRADFQSFPLVAKLVQWGIAAHMGILFGVPNQIVVALLGIGLIVTILYGYRIWWRNRPAPGALPQTLVQSWLRLSRPVKVGVVLTAIALGWALPTLGTSLAAFLLVDVIRWKRVRRRISVPAAAE